MTESEQFTLDRGPVSRSEQVQQDWLLRVFSI